MNDKYKSAETRLHRLELHAFKSIGLPNSSIHFRPPSFDFPSLGPHKGEGSDITKDSPKVATFDELREAMQHEVFSLRSSVSNLHDAFERDRVDLSATKVAVQKAVDDARADISKEVEQMKADMNYKISLTNQQITKESHFVRYQVAGTFTLLAVIITIYSVTAHLRAFNKPLVQRRILAILWLVPVYSVSSWLSLVFAGAQHSLDMVRDMYEAYAIYTFFALLIAVLGGNDGLEGARLKIEQQILRQRITAEAKVAALGRVELELPMWKRAIGKICDPVILLLQKIGVKSVQPTPMVHSTARDDEEAPVSNSTLRRASIASDFPIRASAGAAPIVPPFWCVKYQKSNPSSTAAAVLFQCQLAALQFVLLKPILAVVPVILRACGVHYYEHKMLIPGTYWLNYASPRMYIHVLLNISVCTAFYGLLTFYKATVDDLSWCDPWPKFVCMKSVVFVTFWQGLCLDVLNAFEFVDYETAKVAQNLLICIEMLIASLAFHFIFPSYQWEEGYRKKKEEEHLLLQSLALRDFMSDVSSVFGRQAFNGVQKDEFDQDKTNANDLAAMEMHVGLTAGKRASFVEAGVLQAPSSMSSVANVLPFPSQSLATASISNSSSRPPSPEVIDEHTRMTTPGTESQSQLKSFFSEADEAMISGASMKTDKKQC
jgi:hypothetical protein